MASSLWRITIYICVYTILMDAAISELLNKQAPSGVQPYAKVLFPLRATRGDTKCYPAHFTMCPRSYTIDSLIVSPIKKYILIHPLGNGFFGDTWIVSHIFDQSTHFVLKKIRPQVAEHADFHLSWGRERYFGHKISKIKQNKHLGRSVESFHDGDGLYLISLFEGKSLKSIMYDAEREWWIWMKTTKEGQKAMKTVIFQLLEALDFCNKNNITHRDVKPSNIVICPVRSQGSCLIDPRSDEFRSSDIHLRLIDFGSAVDEFSAAHLYGSMGPSILEQYSLYVAPEAILSNSWLLGPSSSKYDVWTAGQMIMELVLGSSSVFQLTTPVGISVSQSLAYDPHADFYYRLFGWGEFCIAPAGYSDHALVINCNEDQFADYVRRRDPLHIGFPDVSLLRLVRDLLHGDPNFRISAGDALTHAYFQKSNEVKMVDSWVEKWKEVCLGLWNRLWF